MRRAKGLLLTLLVVALVLLGGCAQPSTAPTADLKIGVLLPYSGVYANLGEAITNGMVMYFESIGNEVAGRKITMVKEDSEADTTVGLRKARKLVEQDKVDITTGIVSSGVALAVRDYFDENKAILVVSNAGADDLTKKRPSKYIFRTSFLNSEGPAAIGGWAAQNLGKTAVGIAPDYTAGKDMVGGFKKTFEGAGGKMTNELYPKLGTNDFAPFLAQLQQLKPDVVFAFFSGTDAFRFIKQYEEYGLKGKIPLAAAGFALEEDVLKVVGEAALGHFSALHWAYGLDTAANKAFVKDYEEKFKTTPDVFAVQGYETAKYIADAIAKVSGNTQEKDALVQALETTTVSGPRGDSKIDPKSHQIIQAYYLRKVEKFPDGKPHNAVIATVRDLGN